MVKKLRWGVIGSCGIARRRTIPEGIVPSANGELAAVYDVNSAANSQVARQFSATPVASIDDLLSRSDVVYVATPNYLHCAQVLACAEAVRPVLCEKPLGITVAEADQMRAACRRAGVQLGTAFMMRFVAQHQTAARLIREGKLGKLTYGRAQLSCWYPPIDGAWRQVPELGGGGALMDMGGHCIDLLEMFFGPARQVSCLVNRTVHAYPSEDSAVVLLRFDTAMATVDTFFCIPDSSSRNALELYGSHGSILAQGTIGQAAAGTMRAYLAREGTSYDARQDRAAGDGVAMEPPPINPYRAEIEEFAQAVIDGREPAHGAELGVRSQHVLAACYESARSRRVVDIAWT
ncbi:MAG: hypothetical protein A2W31_10550 [Planctomycetes bacterium RBG_16_64_10]|nr:MAG: hypothetical protein A2W31_10550 [Planctomycetes bacterium RBG_16_64_10]